ncbi:MAG: radical SAM protein [Thermovirgaceae bacterium]|jgi:DNA repair photolyase|nr:radical SAM protein [Synergistales bacterium]MDI9393115.1 radical SAM protein [Synergistota bacterium]MDY0178458.1 radical SAM protein [Synergistaceae bacterium]HRV70706.1 radical SAM protein [Thermovirgaceae bacterium]MDD3134154.1 radical SAM protein [Synergistales bacterium]
MKNDRVRGPGTGSLGQGTLFDNDHTAEESPERSISGVKVRDVNCRSALNRTKIPGFDYCMNPYGGCTHGCVYCYASFMCRFSGHEEKWGEYLDVKANFPSILARQLERSRTTPSGRVLLGTVTDAYQPAESRYRLTRSSLEILAGHPRMEVHVLTKSALVRRDIPVLRKLKGCEVGFTITTLDEGIARIMEPGASSPLLRIETAEELMKEGIPVWVFVAPLLPGLTDRKDSVLELLAALGEKGIRHVGFDPLNPYPAVIERLRGTYRRHFPDQLVILEEFIKQPRNLRRETAKHFRRMTAGR